MRSLSFRKRSDSNPGSSESFARHDLSIIDRIFESISLYEWFGISKEIIKFQKSTLTSDISLEDNIQKCLQYMNKNNLGLIAIINSDRSLL